ncbi:unnamed protein product [Menidia menidia]|uniref:(Atlantic silverside) hypothetical protein n=1 Tax=Menidia menidia TaxID=238744 RepID=A0A8S4BNS0_9TELE|nr:unnamed protein product [Menidia menidia]
MACRGRTERTVPFAPLLFSSPPSFPAMLQTEPSPSLTESDASLLLPPVLTVELLSIGISQSRRVTTPDHQITRTHHPN